MPETVILSGHHIGYQFAKKSMGERRFHRKVYDKGTRPYCIFLGRKVYLRSVGGSSHIFETTRKSMNNDPLLSIKKRIQERWNEANLRPLPSDDPFDQAIFFAGMADEPGKNLSESEQQALSAFIFQLVGIDDEA